MSRYLILYILFLTPFAVLGQDKVMDPQVRHLLDSLDWRVVKLEKEVKKRSKKRDATYFSTKRELEMVIFEREYEELIYDENLMAADKLIDSRVKAAQKKYDSHAEKYFKSYGTKLTKLRASKQQHYQNLFYKDKNFRKEYERYIEVIDEYSLQRAMRMIDLAIKYAGDQDRKGTLEYLYKYKDYTKALQLDLESDFDLEYLTGKSSKYEKFVEPLMESDSLEDIQTADDLIQACYMYSGLSRAKVPPGYFQKQKIVVANAITDWSKRQGITAQLDELTGAATITRFDSLNREGLYKWNEYIVVIGTIKFSSKSEMVRRGEVIIHADETLFDYIRVNRFSKLSGTASAKGTFILPYNEDGKKRYYKFDENKKAFQYMVCYSEVVNSKVTDEMSRFLPPMQFFEETVN